MTRARRLMRLLMCAAILGPAAVPAFPRSVLAREADPTVDRTAPGGSLGRWMVGVHCGLLDGIPTHPPRTDSRTLGFELGNVLGYQSVRVLTYRCVWVNRALDFPTALHRSQLHRIAGLYRLYLMPDHWAGPLLQVGPGLIVAQNSYLPRLRGEDPYNVYGGLVLGTGLYGHLNSQVSVRADVLFERYKTGRFFSHDAAWSHEFSLGMNAVIGMPRHD
jgi:hypothetical protein